MHFDMVSWQDKDLSAIARKMDNIQRRLDLARGGKKTQKLQKEVLARLDEIIKELENQNDKDCDCSGGGTWRPTPTRSPGTCGGRGCRRPTRTPSGWCGRSVGLDGTTRAADSGR